MFANFLQRTDSRDIIDVIRKNILVQASKDENPSKGTPKEIRQQPSALRNFMALLKLKEEKAKAKNLNIQAKQKEKILFDKIYKNSKSRTSLLSRQCLINFA